MDSDEERVATEFVDFSHPVSTERLRLKARHSHAGLHIVQGSLAANEGGLIGSNQFSIVVHKGEPLEMEWRLPGSDRLHRKHIAFGDVHINRGDNPLFLRWGTDTKILAMALDHSLIDRVGEEEFGRSVMSLQTHIGIRDNQLLASASAWRESLEANSGGEKLFSEHLAIVLAVHLFRRYSDIAWQPELAKGGLGALKLRRVIDYIEAHLDEDLSLATLAGVADRSLFHFAAAFRESVGMTPHQFVMNRRITRAKVLLLSTDMTITEIAFAVGYASQSHFALKFKTLTGETPQRFRLDRQV